MNIIANYKIKYEGTYNGPADPILVHFILDRFGVTDEIYCAWLIETDGGPIQSDWFDGTSELLDSQEKLANESWRINGFVIGWDGSGNPIVMLSDGSIAIEDHDFGGIHSLAKNFKSLLSKSVSS